MPTAINRGTLIKETQALEWDLLKGLDVARLEDWIGDSDLRQELLKNTVFGRIRWSKSLGAPISPTLNQGFTILHWNTTINVSYGPDGAVETSNTTLQAEPFKWDAQEDTDHYSVGFFTYVRLEYIQTFQPTFASGVAWPHFLDSYRQIDPVSRAISEFNTTVILPDFSIVSHIY